MSKISDIQSQEIIASSGNPTIEATVTLDSGAFATASVAYGASAGTQEAVTLIDGDPARYHGQGMLKAIENIQHIISPALIGQESTHQVEIDHKMIELDGTPNKSRLGGNAILAVSLAVARASAVDQKYELYRYLSEIFSLKKDNCQLPKPMAVLIEGGRHADNTTDLQEYLVSCLANRTVSENIRMVMEINQALKLILQKESLSTNVGNEGAFAPSGIASNEKPLEYLLKAITDAGYKPSFDVGISIDAAASEFYDSNAYHLKKESKTLTAEELISYYMAWVDKYPFVSWEDMLAENDSGNWPALMEKIKGKIRLVADDLTVTNKDLLAKAAASNSADAIIIKPNQAGTLTETIECCQKAHELGFITIVSHRGGGETNDTFMVDLAVAVGSRYIKVGPSRGERVCKYNRLMAIEAKTNS